MPDVGGVREQNIPWRQLQHWLLGSTGKERCRLGQRQPPVLRVAPRFSANIAVVSLCKRHTNNSPSRKVAHHGCTPPRTKGKLAGASPGEPSPEVGMRPTLFGRKSVPGRIVIDP